MKLGLLLAVLLTLALDLRAQQPELDIKGLLDTAEQWAQENLDEDVLAALSEVDRAQVETFLHQFQTQLQSEYVLDLGALDGAAKTVLPLLDTHEETRPYAAWLRSRLDYFEVAEDFRKETPTPKLIPGETAKPTPNPSADAERKSWQNKLSQRSWPIGAKELVPTLKPIFANERVPQELVWVAEVESGFNPKARSPVGAAGLFQLMPATAQRFGLSTSWLRDQRYQPGPSSRAAAQYLKQLHKEFGDWRLALAAYNAGEGTVQKLLARHKTRTFDGIATHLPAETQMFVPKVEATVWRREGVPLAGLKIAEARIPNYPSSQPTKGNN